MSVVARQWMPNLLTASRFPLSVAFYWLAVRERFVAALSVLVLAQTTDWIDGALARRWKTQSPFGAAVERIADSFMLAVAGFALMQIGAIPAWLYVGCVIYTALTWVAPQRIKRLWLLNAVLGMRTLLYGTSLAIIPFLLLKMIAERHPVVALGMLAAFIVYGFGTLYWKRGRIQYYWRRFRRGRSAAIR